MTLPSLRQLRFLVALADELNFSRAAERCNVTQPTLSSALAELEATLRVPLAERTKRSVTLTPVGRMIAERARAILADAEDLVDLAAQHAGTLRGELTLGTIPTIGPFLIPKVLPAIRQAFPSLRLYLREELTESLIAGLRAGRLDVILIAVPFETGELILAPLFEDGYQLAVPPGHELADCAEISGRELEKHRLLLLEKGHCLQRHALSAFSEVAMIRDESFAATSLYTLIAMVENGLGMTLLPQLAVNAGVTRGFAVSLNALKGACPRKIVLAWRPATVRAADFEALAEIFRGASS